MSGWPGTDEIRASYARLADEYIAATKDFEPFPGLRGEVLGFLRSLPPGPLLDLGCGAGRDAALALSLGRQTVLADICLELLTKARQRISTDLASSSFSLRQAAFAGAAAPPAFAGVPAAGSAAGEAAAPPTLAGVAVPGEAAAPPTFAGVPAAGSAAGEAAAPPTLAGVLAVCCDATALPFRDGTFAGVLASGVLLHLPPAYLRLALEGIERVMLPGGLAAISMKHGGVDGWRSTADFPLPRWFSYHRPEDFAQMCREVGLKVLSVDRSRRKDWFTVVAARPDA